MCLNYDSYNGIQFQVSKPGLSEKRTSAIPAAPLIPYPILYFKLHSSNSTISPILRGLPKTTLSIVVKKINWRGCKISGSITGTGTQKQLLRAEPILSPPQS
jgi:hypothetical protein